jgi:hypothetical protein
MHRLAVVLLVGILVAGMLATPVVARHAAQPSAGTLDQAQPQSANWTAGQTVGLDQVVGQVFTAGLSGPLFSVWLGLWSAGATTPDVTFPDAIVELRTVDPLTGLPTATVLTQAQIPNSALPASGDIGVLITFANPAIVAAGTQYAIIVRSAGPENPYACCSWSYQTSDVYPAGSLVTSYASGPFFAANDSADLAFETYVLDLVAPVITEQSNLLIRASSIRGANVAFTITTSDEHDPAPAIHCWDQWQRPMSPSGGWFRLGLTWITCIATDAAGNQSERERFLVLVTLGRR